jgi:hypothetical protein
MRYKKAIKLAIPMLNAKLNDLYKKIKAHKAANSPIARHNNFFFTLFILFPIQTLLHFSTNRACSKTIAQ